MGKQRDEPEVFANLTEGQKNVMDSWRSTMTKSKGEACQRCGFNCGNTCGPLCAECGNEITMERPELDKRGWPFHFDCLMELPEDER